MMRRKWMRGIAALCIGAFLSSSVQVFAEEYTERPAYDQEETALSGSETESVMAQDIDKTELPEHGTEDEADHILDLTEGSDTTNSEEPGTANEETDNVEDPVSGTEALGEAEDPTDESNADSVPEVENEKTEADMEQQHADEEIIVQETDMESNEQEETEEDDDPQRGTSMSNMEGGSEETVIFSSRSYTGSTYTHNSRYNSGYTIVNGVDVSYYNGSIDWDAVASSGIEYAMIRVGYRGYGSAGTLREDPKFRENITGALNAGLKVGVYIFSQAITKEEAVEEADFVLDRIAGYRISLPVVIDYEYADGNIGRLYNANLSRTKATSICRNFCRTVEGEGYTAMVYANKSMLENSLHTEELSASYKIWLANYTTKTSYSGDYYAWQYTSKGMVSGISGNVDCNFFYEKTGSNGSNGNSAGSLEGARTYVKRLYWELLGREADEGELNTRANAIANGSSGASDAALSIISSAEFVNQQDSDRVYINKLYWALLDRGPSEGEVERLVNQLETGVSRRFILNQITNMDEFANICSGLKIAKGSIQLVESRDKNYEVTAYVSRCYMNILERSADVEGLNTWTEKILAGNEGAEIVKDLVLSREFSNKNMSAGEFIDIIYRAMLGRASDASGRADWLNRLNEGVSYVYIINGFAGSSEFNALCAQYGIKAGSASVTEARDRNIGVTGFVNRNYKFILGRNGEPAGLNNWCDVIIRKTASPGEVARGFVFSQEAINKNLNNADFTEMLYQAFLGRDSDSTGKQGWIDALNRGTTRESVFWGFANSAEFSAIVAEYGL